MKTISVDGWFGVEIDFAQFLVNCGMVESKSDYNRLALAGAIKVKQALDEPDYPLDIVKTRKYFVPINDDFVVKVGKLKQKRFRIVDSSLARITATVEDLPDAE
jgi:hypothetical protein